jgi:peptidoglycan/LPS O-acetylase OafA/YrhL
MRKEKLSVRSYRPELDGLRALAAIAVIIFHFNSEILPSGFLGVDIFFVISGFVVTSSLVKTLPIESVRDFLLSFYFRRVKRIVPALVACVVITAIFGCLFIAPQANEYRASLLTGAASLVGSSNLYLLRESTDYFGASSELNLFTQTWSLGVEEQFYLVFPMIFAVCNFKIKHGNKVRRKLFSIVLSLSILSFVGWFYLAGHNPPTAFFMMPARFWEVGAGCLTLLAIDRIDRHWITAWKVWIAPVSILLLIGVMLLDRDLQILTTIISIILSCAALWSLDRPSPIVSFFSSKWVVKIGLLSYSLYLWHWSVLVLSRWTVGISAWTIPIQLLLIFSLAFASYHWIEKPLRYANWSKTKLQTIGYSLSASFAAILLLYSLTLSPLKGKLYSTDSYPFEQLLSRSSSMLPDYNNANCHIDQGKLPTDQQYQKCHIVNPLGKKVIFFLGNSHTDHLRMLHSKVFKNTDFSIDGLSQSNCQFPYSGERSEKCNDFQSRQYDRVISTAKQGDLVVVSNRYFVEDWSNSNSNRNISWVGLDGVVPSLNNFSQRLANKGVAVIVFMPIPEFQTVTQLCVPAWFRPKSLDFDRLCHPSKENLQTLRQPATNYLSTNLSKKIYRYDAFNVLCPGGKCAHFDERTNKPLFVDADHLTNYGAEYLYEDFMDFLRKTHLVTIAKTPTSDTPHNGYLASLPSSQNPDK